MGTPSFPWFVMWTLTLFSSASVIYYAAIISGLYKDPLMARFRVYGEERRVYPLPRFLAAVCIWCILMSFMVRAILATMLIMSTSFAPLSFTVMALMAFIGYLITRRYVYLRELLPHWYFTLLRNATRQERRLLAFAWLRIPRRMRWHLNGDQAAFEVWADMVRMSVIYGARDPDDPWVLWT
jgi:hypothetical protein